VCVLSFRLTARFGDRKRSSTASYSVRKPSIWMKLYLTWCGESYWWSCTYMCTLKDSRFSPHYLSSSQTLSAPESPPRLLDSLIRHNLLRCWINILLIHTHNTATQVSSNSPAILRSPYCWKNRMHSSMVQCGQLIITYQ